MLVQLFALYLESLVLTILLVLVVLGIWIGLRAGVDKTAKERQAHLYDMIMIGVLTIPVLSFATMSILLVLKA